MSERMDLVTFRRYVYYKLPDNAMIAVSRNYWNKKQLIERLEQSLRNCQDCMVEFEWDEADGYLNVEAIYCADSIGVKQCLMDEMAERMVVVSVLQEVKHE